MARRFAQTMTIDAPVDAIWPVLSDVVRWAEWTPTILKVEPLTETPLAVGRRYRVTQPRSQPLVYEVTSLEPGRGFSWRATAPGVVVTADHNLANKGAGTELELVFAYGGALGSLLGIVFAGLTARYLRTEAEQLKKLCEAAPVR